MTFAMKRSLALRIWAGGLFGMSLLLSGRVMAQNVLWEDYRGQSNVATDANYIGPAGKPKFTNNPNNVALAALRTISANPDNAARTGSSTNINFLAADTNTLCNNSGGTGSTACRYQAQGRVMYSLIQFPAAGAYTLRAAHDDNLAVELSTDYANTNYRNASYDIPVGALAEWTANDSTFETIGTFNAAGANSCALIRVYWTNQGGINHSRLQWTRPGNVTEIIPASAFRDPSLSTSANGCNGSITGNGNALTLNKVIGSQRLNANDQFTIEIGTAQTGGTVRSATTSGAGTGQQASTGAFPGTTGTTYYLREVMAAGSASALTDYTATIACTRNGAPFTPTQEGAAANRTWSVSLQANNQIVCSITNTARPTVTVRKISIGGTGTFGFTGSNGVASQSLTTTTAGVAVSGSPSLLTTTGAVTTITESVPPAGYVLDSIACTGLGTGTASYNLSTRTATLDAAATAAGNAVTCTFTNRLTADLSVTKTNTPGINGNVDQAGDTVTAGGTTAYTIRVTNNGPAGVTGAVLSDPAITGLTKIQVACSPTPGQCTAGTTPTVAQLESGYALPTLANGQFYEIVVTATVMATGQ